MYYHLLIKIMPIDICIYEFYLLHWKLLFFNKFHFYLRGGGGVHPDYFVKLDFEIAVDQQTRARDRTFEGVPDSG